MAVWHQAGTACVLVVVACYHVSLNQVERLKKKLIPDLDRLCVWGRITGLQHGSNEAAPLDIERQEHEIQRVRYIDRYCLVLLQHGIVACVANANENDARILARLLYHDGGDKPEERYSNSTNIEHQVGIVLRA